MAETRKHQAAPLKGLGGTVRYAAELEGHEVELQFDRAKVVLNTARLVVDGELVDRRNVFYGEKDLRATLEDGTEIEVLIDSGMAGELTRAQMRRADGSYVDLAERRD